MQQLLTISIVIAALWFSGSSASQASEDIFYLKFYCSGGEKPGSSDYELLILGNQFRVQKRYQITKKLIEYGSLSGAETATLKALAERAGAELKARRDTTLLTGYCLLGFSGNGSEVDEDFSQAIKPGPSLAKLVEWIRTLHSKNAQLKRITPIVPGVEAPIGQR